LPTQGRLVEPDPVIDLKTIPGLDRIEYDERKGLRIGALVTLTKLEEHPAIAEPAAQVGSPQIRNLGTVGGNLCQKPRCWYYRGNFPCLRRGGDYCSAAAGQNKYHCILGGDPCYMVHPSDPAAPLVAHDAELEIVGPKGKRTVPLREFFVLPKDDVTRETVLGPGKLVTTVVVPPHRSRKSAFLKFTERGRGTSQSRAWRRLWRDGTVDWRGPACAGRCGARAVACPEGLGDAGGEGSGGCGVPGNR